MIYEIANIMNYFDELYLQLSVNKG